MTTSAYAMVAQVRRRELRTRLALAAFIGVTTWLIAPSIWPMVWMAAVVVTQLIDLAICSPLRTRPGRAPSRAERILCCASVSMTVVAYSAITAYLWFQGGEAGRVFAMIQAAGGLLHVSLHMQHERALLLSAAIPHALYFLGLPILGAIIDRQPLQAVVALAGCLYLAHLVVAVRQTVATTRALRRANREAGLERRRAEVASAAKSDFLAVISHEIRTPMNAVISAAHLLRRTRLDSAQREHVAMLVDAGDVLVGLLNDVLDFSKIEAGKMTLESAEMDLREKLGALGRLWEPKAAAQGVRLTVRIADDAPACIRTDPLRLQQILFNLLSNAVKFTDAGRVDVEAAWDAARSRLSITVQDTGCGIPAERLSHVFESFQQVDAGTTRRYGGTGLGLAISRRLAEIMGGELTASSVEGEGSTFRLVLPVESVDLAAPRRQAVADQGATLKGRSILAADDHPVNRRILSLMLEPHGCRLTLVENGAEAVEAAAAEPFDVIVMDMQMPVMDGLDATRNIRAAGRNRETPVIALTANALDAHRAAWEALDVHAFLTKPIDPGLLVAALADACSRPVREATAAA